MTFPKSTFRQMFYFFSLLVVLTSLGTGEVWASPTGFEPPPGRDAPRGGTVGGGSRPVKTACLASSSAGSLTALSPGRQLGLTGVDRPSFLVYVPATTAQTAEFSLFDQQMKGIYQVNIPVSKPGLLKISLPDNAPTLVKNQPYYWTVALACNPKDRTEDWVVGGWIEYAQPNDSLRQQLASVAEVEKVSVYAKQGFWYDAITTLVELQRRQPDNLQLAQMQKELLESGGLEAIATVPLQ